ncbi:MAG: hypothetical protein NTU44_13780 [Bacteroidetes bacterium]|nr:hypothetical protein [Bacteroidota bacterium]
MRGWITIFFSIFIFLCGTSSTKGQSRGKVPADSLFALGRYREASIEYERIYYFSEEAQQRAAARLSRAECHKQLGSFSDARRDLDEIPLSGLPDSTVSRIRYQQALTSYLGGDFEAVRSQIEQIRFFSAPYATGREITLLEILNENERHQYQRAKELIIKWLSTTVMNESIRDSLLRQVEKHYRKGHLPRIANEKKAVNFSRFIPGSGQVYDGFPGEGSVNFLLNFAALATGVYGFYCGYYFTGYLVGAGLLQKLYFGGLRRTSILAEKGNYLRAMHFNDEVKSFILGIYSYR